MTTEARPAEVEHLRALAAPDLDCDRFAHHLGGEELDDATELGENDLVDRTLRPPRRHRGLGVQPGPSLFLRHHFATQPDADPRILDQLGQNDSD